MKESIINSSDFLFIYEAIQCNPNGDPDQENKPRMDYDTGTNLVTDTRVKRFIRDYLKEKGYQIFVDMEGDTKVRMDKRLENLISPFWSNDSKMELLINNPGLFKAYKNLKEDTFEKTIKKLISKKPEDKEVNRAILTGLVRDEFIDIRLFGSAFAVDGFNKPFTGPIQMNWGYSFNKVELIDSNTITSIMNEGNSTFGKDYRVHYSLLGFNGVINSHAAKTTGLTDNDVKIFRDAIWQSIPANPTRSKLNQYPKAYIEIVYNEGISNGQLGDLRNFINVKPEPKKTDKEVRKFTDLTVSFDRLIKIIADNKGTDKKIKDVIMTTSPDLTLPKI